MKKWYINKKNEKHIHSDKLMHQEKPIAETAGMQGSVLCPLDEVNGYLIRPGFYRMNGAFQTANGVSFTVSSHEATEC
ncbi:MAG: hypothetical protein IJ274_08610, partial [Lachnospiraceae bacterium]|nr:hypothetical protein [Lachnospiraceae bacterium]